MYLIFVLAYLKAQQDNNCLARGEEQQQKQSCCCTSSKHLSVAHLSHISHLPESGQN